MRRLAGAVGQWLLAGALYLGFAGSTDLPELVAAAGTAGFVVGFVFWCRRGRAVVMRARPSWLHILPRVLRTLAIETVLVGGALLTLLLGRRRQGEMLSQPFESGREPAPETGRSAVAALVVAASLTIGVAWWRRHGRATMTRLRTSSLGSLPHLLRAPGTQAAAIGGMWLATLLGSPRQRESLPKRFEADRWSASEAGRRALAVLAASAAPDGYVAAVRDDSLLLHRLVPRPQSPDRCWPI